MTVVIRFTEHPVFGSEVTEFTVLFEKRWHSFGTKSRCIKCLRFCFANAESRNTIWEAISVILLRN